jgi:hypothetical protein
VLIVLIVGSVGAFIIRQRRRASGVSS